MTRWDAEQYDAHRGSPPVAVVELIRTRSAAARVLDIGCGTGLFTRLWVGRSDRVVGVDLDADMLAVARRRSAQGDLAYVRARGENLPLRDQWADVVTFASSIHWLPPASTARELLRVLSPAGLVAIIGPATPFPDDCPEVAETITAARRELLQSEAGERPQMWAWEEHLVALREVGLDRVRSEYVTSAARWTVDDLITHMSTTGAARTDAHVLPRLREHLLERLGPDETPWSQPWRMVTVSR
jgi:SAM-dependent methyltransferase